MLKQMITVILESAINLKENRKSLCCAVTIGCNQIEINQKAGKWKYK